MVVPPITTKPKLSKTRITCEPERTLSPPRIGEWGHLVVGQNCRQSLEPKRSRIIAFEIDGDGVSNVFLQLLESGACVAIGASTAAAI
jgi:hypothetical protein